MSKHTPGPWRATRWWEQAGMTLDDAEDDEQRVQWLRAPYTSIEGPDGEPVVTCHDLGTITSANAQAISAVPDMLAALKAIGCCCEMRSGNPMVRSHSDVCERARAAIAKAEGQQIS